MKQAIIVGASSGIGRELAVQLAAKNYQLGLMARRGERLEQLLTDLPREHFIQCADVSNPEQARQQFAKLIELMGDVELIVINAGVGKREKKLDWLAQREMIDVNVRGFAAMSVVAMNHFVERGQGHLVGISSVAAHMSGGLAPTYVASKAFVSSYLNGMRSRAEHCKLPITVTTVEPGFVDTPMVQGQPSFWMATVDRAVAQLVQAIIDKKNHVYITKRWRLAAWILNIMPKWLMRRFF